MLQYMIWVCMALGGGVAGWFAAAWLHQRRIAALQVQLRVMRQTMAAHGDQARRQIGQLQAELAQRPPAPVPESAVEQVRGQIAPLMDGMRRRAAVPDRFVMHEDGFPATAVIGGDGFAPTQISR